MISKVLLGLTVLSVTLLDASASKSCEEDPGVWCIIKAMFHPNRSVKCIVRESRVFEKTSNDYLRLIGSCSTNLIMNPASENFVKIEDEILVYLNKIISACKSKDAAGEIDPGFWCKMKVAYNYLELKKFIKKAAKENTRPEKFNNACIAENVKNYVETFPNFESNLNYCIFHKGLEV